MVLLLLAIQCEIGLELEWHKHDVQIRVSTTPGNPESPGNLLEFKNPPGNPGNLLEFNWSCWKFLCKMLKIDRICFQS